MRRTRTLALAGSLVAGGIGLVRWANRQVAKTDALARELAVARADFQASQQRAIDGVLTSVVSATETLSVNAAETMRTAIEGVLAAVLGARGEDGRIEQVEMAAGMDAGAGVWTDPPPWAARDWTDDLLPDTDGHTGVASLGVGEQLVPGVPRPDMAGEMFVP